MADGVVDAQGQAAGKDTEDKAAKWRWRAPRQEPPDQDKWNEAAATFSTNQLIRVQGMAEKWAGAVTTLLGVFSTVAIVGGTRELAKFADPVQRDQIIQLLAIAGVLAFVSILVASYTAQGPLPKRRSNFNAYTYRDWVNTQTARAAPVLAVARVTGVLAAVLVAYVAFLALQNAAAPAAESPSSTILIIREEAPPICGLISTADDGTVSVGGVAVGEALQAVPVDKC